jgi:hypothetical protein
MEMELGLMMYLRRLRRLTNYRTRPGYGIKFGREIKPLRGVGYHQHFGWKTAVFQLITYFSELNPRFVLVLGLNCSNITVVYID